MDRLTKRMAGHVYYTDGKYEETVPAECETGDVRAILQRLADFEDIGTVEELAALKEAAERIVLMWDNCYIEPYSADVKDYIERMRKAIKEADNDESGN